jgi:hypothetical protein
MRKGTRVILTVDGKEAAARFVNRVTESHSFVQLFGEYRTGPTDDGYRTVETSSIEAVIPPNRATA